MGDFFSSDEMHMENAIRESFEVPGEESRLIIDELKGIMQNHSLKHWRSMCKESIMSMMNEPLGPFPANFNIPVIILFGEKDRLIPNRLFHPSESPESIANCGTSMIPGSRYEIIGKAGHFVQIEKFNEVNRIIGEFVGTA